MPNCGCAGGGRCSCVITAGPGVTVDGDGGSAFPYVISAAPPAVTCDQVRPCLSAGDGVDYDPATGEIAARVSGDAGNTTMIGADGGIYTPTPVATTVAEADTPSVDVTVSGDTATGYTVSAEVNLDPAPPGGGTNLLQEGAGGLYVECADVRGCLSPGDGIDFDPATGEISARPSTDPGNTLVLGGDGGLMVPAGAGTALDVTDTPTVDMTLSGTGAAGDPYTVSAEVTLDPAPPGGGGNLLHEGTDGLYVECADVRGCLSAGDGIGYDPGTGEITARPSGDADNTLVIGSDGGLMVPPGAGGTTALEVTDSPSVDLTLTGDGSAATPYSLTAGVNLDPAPPGGGTNLLHEGTGGLYVECADVRGCVSAGDGLDYDPATGVMEARPSADAGNALAFGSDGGLLVTPGAVSCDDVRPCLSEGDGIDYDPATGVISARPSTEAGNALTIGPDGGLLVTPTAGGDTALQVTDSPTLDLTLSGDGSAATPYQVTGAVRLDATPPGGGSNLIHSNADGLYVECADIRGCISEGDGIDFDPATGVISARPSADAGNTLEIGSDGGLLVPPATAPALTTGCGLTGDGAAASPLAANTQAWPYPCPVDDNGGGVYCDSTGALRSEPRGVTQFTQQHIGTDFNNVAVPTATDVVVLTRNFAVDNPDPCRPAFVIVEQELDVDFNLPAGAGAAAGQGTDEMEYIANRGSTTATDVHVQTTKVFNLAGGIPAGGTANIVFEVTLGRGTNGATYNRIQTFIRVFVIVV